MKIYKEVFVDGSTGEEIRLPIIIDESKLRKADFSVGYKEDDTINDIFPSGFPKNYPSNYSQSPKDRHQKKIKEYRIEMQFDDGEVIFLSFNERDQKLWYDAMEVICGCERERIFGQMKDTFVREVRK